MASAPQLYDSLAARLNLPRIKNLEDDFLGTGWAFAECFDGTAWWISRSGKVVPSERNR